MKEFLKAIAIVMIVCFTVFPFSCKVSEHGLIFLDSSEQLFKCPKIESFSITGSQSMRLVFNENVELKNLCVQPALQIDQSSAQYSDNDGICIYDVSFVQQTDIGKSYSIYGVVEDKIGNSLTFSLPFTGYNSQIPEVEFSEIHPRYSSSKKGDETIYKCEYVELLVTKSGNMSGLKLCSVNDGNAKDYSFPPLEVAAGDIVIVHLRKKREDWISEMDNNIKMAVSKYSSDNARDLYDSNESARLGDEMDILTLENSADGKILDAVCYGNSKYENWKTDLMTQAARRILEAGLWESDKYSDAVCTDELTPSKSIVRIGKGHSASDWKITKTSGETPGIIEY